MAGAINVYPLSNYTHGSNSKQAIVLKDSSRSSRLLRKETIYRKEGIMRTGVDGILLVHDHNHPHVLLLKTGNLYRLPGGCLKNGNDSEIEGLKRKLTRKLGPAYPFPVPDWTIGECVSKWWRPHNYELDMYPYCPPHITKPRECKKIFIVPLPESAHFEIPRNMTLVAVPLFQLYNNLAYGRILSTIPNMVSALQLNLFN